VKLLTMLEVFQLKLITLAFSASAISSERRITEPALVSPMSKCAR